jgi:hypothetical protein
MAGLYAKAPAFVAQADPRLTLESAAAGGKVKILRK